SRLRAISYRITRDRETSEECENDTYLETWNHIPPSEPKDYFYAFLAKITRAISIDRCRERTRLKRDSYIVELTDELEMCIPAVNNVPDDMEAKLLGEAISRYLYTLSDEKQVMFMRRFFYLDTVSEIAKRLSISDSKVKTTLFRIRNELRDYLIKEGYTL
ncbi:MAG: RNA polymerase sigma factor, partial [Clostridia bacterium]|nr:RNA polymerase sigma factor [Clostridia bacterium]